MTKKIVYRYLGTNGMIESPVLLEDTYYIRVAVLTAADGKILTKDGVYSKSVRVPEDEVDLWKEVKDKGQN